MTYTVQKSANHYYSQPVKVSASDGYVIFWHEDPETKKEFALRIPQLYFAELVKKAQILIDEDVAKREFQAKKIPSGN